MNLNLNGLILDFGSHLSPEVSIHCWPDKFDAATGVGMLKDVLAGLDKWAHGLQLRDYVPASVFQEMLSFGDDLFMMK